jgi:hypothetical protein
MQWFRRLVASLSPWFDPRPVHINLWWTKWHSDTVRSHTSVSFREFSIFIVITDLFVAQTVIRGMQSRIRMDYLKKFGNLQTKNNLFKIGENSA